MVLYHKLGARSLRTADDKWHLSTHMRHHKKVHYHIDFFHWNSIEEFQSGCHTCGYCRHLETVPPRAGRCDTSEVLYLQSLNFRTYLCLFIVSYSLCKSKIQVKICKRWLFECGIGKYSTRPRNKVWALRWIAYLLDMCCIFPYRTKMNTVCIFSHDSPKLSTTGRSVQSTDMTFVYKVVNRRRSVNSIPHSNAKGAS